MAKKKEGELRLLKDGVIFGPTDRAGMERLLASGRVTPNDRVSVRNADWISIAEFLATPAPPVSATPPVSAMPPVSAPASPTPAALPSAKEASPPPLAKGKKAGDLRVIKGGSVIAALTRTDVQQLMDGGRLGDDDLVCALDGPWMRVGDFLSTKARPSASRQRWSHPAKTAPEHPQSAPPGPDPSGPVARPVDRSVDASASPPMVVMAGRVEIMQPNAPPSLALVKPMSVVESRTSPAGVSYRVSSASEEKSWVDDQWYVRIRAMCSAPLGKRHLKALYQSREINAETLARHPKWSENDWRPISSIPELAELSRP